MINLDKERIIKMMIDMSNTKTMARKEDDVYPKLSERVVRAAERLERLRRVNPDSYRHILALIDVIR